MQLLSVLGYRYQVNYNAPTSYFMLILLVNANPSYISTGEEKTIVDCI
jgi:hypothetical protein